MLGTWSAAPETRSVLGCRSINKQSFISFLAGRKHHSFPWSIDSNHGICICLAVYLTVQTASQPATGPECVCQTSRSEKKHGCHKLSKLNNVWAPKKIVHSRRQTWVLAVATCSKIPNWWLLGKLLLKKHNSTGNKQVLWLITWLTVGFMI